MSVIVTGADGFVGRHLVSALLSHGVNQIIAIVGPKRLATTPLAHMEHVQIESSDLLDPSSFRSIIRKYKPTQVYHLAGIAVTHSTSYDEYDRVNIRGTYEWAQVVLEELGSTCKFLFVSSSGVYGSLPSDQPYFTENSPLRPGSLYGVSKANAEMLLHTLITRGLDARIARPFNHTGPGQQPGFLCPDLALRIRKALSETDTGSVKIAIGRLDGIRDFLDVRDVVKGYIAMQESTSSGSTCNVCSGVGHTVGDIARLLADQASVGRKIDFEVTTELVRQDPSRMIGSNALLSQLTSWRPSYTLQDTMRDLWTSI